MNNDKTEIIAAIVGPNGVLGHNAIVEDNVVTGIHASSSASLQDIVAIHGSIQAYTIQGKTDGKLSNTCVTAININAPSNILQENQDNHFSIDATGIRVHGGIQLTNSQLNVTVVGQNNVTPSHFCIPCYKHRFNLHAPYAKTVHLAGNFNHWLNAHEGKIQGECSKWLMEKDALGNWEILIELAPADYEFKYVIDYNAWQTDQGFPLSSAGNSYLSIKVDPAFAVNLKHEINEQLKTFYLATNSYIATPFKTLKLPILKCFIHVAIVDRESQNLAEEEHFQNRKNKSQSTTFLSQQQIYSSYENIYSSKGKRSVSPATLFESAAHRKTTRRLLVIGRAGIGKSVLSQYLSYMWAAPDKQLLKGKFDWLFKLKLRNLTVAKYPPGTHLIDILMQECFNLSEFTETTLSKFKSWLVYIIEHFPERILMILDGYDELNRSPSNSCHKIVLDIIHHPKFHVVVTTRPFTDLNEIDFDDVLECLGFNDEDIIKFIQLNELNANMDRQTEILDLLEKKQIIRSLAHVPLFLIMLCKRWQNELVACSTMTQLFLYFFKETWRDYGVRHNDLSDSELDKLEAETNSFLDLLAFRAMEQNIILIPITLTDQVMHTLFPHGDATLTRNFKKFLNVGFLYSSNDESYYFLHLTFQEFFAARFISLALARNDETIMCFILQNKHNPRFEVTWWFAAGLLKDNEQALRNFFAILHGELPDLIGVSEQLLLVRCLNECEFHLSAATSTNILTRLKPWINLILFEKPFRLPFFTNYLDLCADIYERTGVNQRLSTLIHSDQSDEQVLAAKALAGRTILVEKFSQNLVSLLCSKDQNVQRSAELSLIVYCQLRHKIPAPPLLQLQQLFHDNDIDIQRSAARVLLRSFDLSGNMQRFCIAALRHKDYYIADTAADVLAAYDEMPDDALQQLASMLPEVNGDEEVGGDELEFVLTALLSKNMLPENIIQILIELLEKEYDNEIVGLIVEILSEQTSLPLPVVQHLSDLLSSGYEDIELDAIEILGGQKHLPDQILLKLSNFLNHKNNTVRYAAIKALSNRQLSIETIQHISTSLLLSSKWKNREAGVMILSGQRTLPAHVKQQIALLLDDKEWEVRLAVVITLGAQEELSDFIIEKLLNRLNDVREIRIAILNVFKVHTNLSDNQKLRIAELLHDERSKVKIAAIEGLSTQNQLPVIIIDQVVELFIKPGEKAKTVETAANILGKQKSLSIAALDKIGCGSITHDKALDLIGLAVQELSLQYFIEQIRTIFTNKPLFSTLCRVFFLKCVNDKIAAYFDSNNQLHLNSESFLPPFTNQEKDAFVYELHTIRSKILEEVPSTTARTNSLAHSAFSNNDSLPSSLNPPTDSSSDTNSFAPLFVPSNSNGKERNSSKFRQSSGRLQVGSIESIESPQINEQCTDADEDDSQLELPPSKSSNP